MLRSMMVVGTIGIRVIKKDPKKYPVQKGTPGTSSYKVYAGNEASR